MNRVSDPRAEDDDITRVTGAPCLPQDDPDQTLVKGAVAFSLPMPEAVKPARPFQPQSGTALALPAGFRLHEYRIDRVLGQGGFGITYLATDVNLNARVAIKEYLPEEIAFRTSGKTVSAHSSRYLPRYKSGLSSFLVEGRTLATFRHPHIVRVSRFFEAHQTAYMVLDYEPGESFRTWWPAHAHLGEKALARLLQPLLDGLSVVHAAGFLHRDIKPDNIQVRRYDGSLVLLDFGSARQAVGGGTDDDVAVTPGYAPIEQYEDGAQGAWTDIYAMGATLYWAVTGRKPPDAMDRLIAAGRGADPLIPAKQAGQGRFSEPFLAAIDWALALQPGDRPQDITPWRAALFAAHASSLGLREALMAGDAPALPGLQGWAVLRSPAQWGPHLRRAWRQLVQPASWPMAVKMSVAMTVAALAPMLATGYVNLQGSLDAVSQAELSNLEQLARGAAARVSQLIEDTDLLAGSLASDAALSGFLHAPDEGAAQALRHKFERLVQANPELHLMMLMDLQGQVLVSSDPQITGRNFGFRDYFQSARAGRRHVSGMVVGSVTGQAGMFHAVPVLDEARAVIGVLAMRIRAEAFRTMLKESTDDAQLTPFMVDGDGVVITHPDARLLYRSLAPLPPKALERIHADRRFQRERIDDLGLVDLARAMVGASRQGHLAYHSPLSREDEIAGFAPVSGHNWVVGVSESRAAFQAPVDRLFTQLLWSMGLVGLLFVGLALLLARSIVRPIQALTRAAEALKRGDFAKASLVVRTRDEIGQLSRTFNVLIDVLRQRERERSSPQDSGSGSPHR
ncbi:MAG TPA: cache domain-containing protein [Aquabacterium sp.]|uniref:protein kinase domain-containing protein n=1 Tax=Aquabacterium sp. TaxID=1872578 RepID=UPI002E312CCE|nr:cache domain-containing protein [Aquabacterium sp.]HEX5372030.1 cache domain-containing protein [Aquabacterium sp.]